VITQLERVSSLAQRFLDFSKPSRGDIGFEDVNLETAVKGVLSWVSQLLEKEKVRVQNQVDPEATVSMNQRDLEEIFVNLITNAYQAMRGGGTLCIADEIQDGRIRVFVSDTGKGIPSDKIKQVFDPFVSHDKEKGTGLGLYIVKKLVERNWGSIQLASEVGKGTTFQIDLPLSRVRRRGED